MSFSEEFVTINPTSSCIIDVFGSTIPTLLLDTDFHSFINYLRTCKTLLNFKLGWSKIVKADFYKKHFEAIDANCLQFFEYITSSDMVRTVCRWKLPRYGSTYYYEFN